MRKAALANIVRTCAGLWVVFDARPNYLAQRWVVYRETTENAMAEQHPVQAFRAALETARLDLIERLAKLPSPLTESDLQLLATIQTALSAVREEIQAHGIGWGGQDTLE
jgi:hypothetical protein